MLATLIKHPRDRPLKQREAREGRKMRPKDYGKAINPRENFGEELTGSFLEGVAASTDKYAA